MNGKRPKVVDLQYDIEQLRDEMENDPEVIDDPSGERAQEYGEDLDELYKKI